MEIVAAILSLAVAPATREVVAPTAASAVVLVHADASALRAIDRQRYKAWEYMKENGVKVGTFKSILPYMRYFWYPYDKVKVEDRLIAFKLLFNKLSTQPEFLTPALVASNVLRIDTRALGWGEHQLSVLEKFQENGIDPFFHAQKEWAEDDPVELITYWPGGKDKDGERHERGRYGYFPKKGDKRFVPHPLLPQEQIDDLRKWLYSEVPVLHMEQFFLYASRQQSPRNKEEGVGYYEWFGEKGLKTRDDYFEVVGLDVKRAQKQFKEWRAIILAKTSKVSINTRFVYGFQGVNGRVWITDDFFSEDARNFPALRLRNGEVQPDANELFGPLANGLPITFLAAANKDKDKDGKAQAKAPPEVGVDDSSHRIGRDGAIHDDMSCMRSCHAKDDFLPKFADRDHVRKYFAQGKGRVLTDPDPDVELELRRQYQSDLHELLEKDRKDYSSAIAKCTISARHPKGLSCTKAMDIYCNLWNELYEADPRTERAPITRAVLCRHLGVSEQHFKDSLAKYTRFRGQGNLLTERFSDDDGAMSWEELEASYSFFAGLMVGQAIPEKVRREKRE